MGYLSRRSLLLAWNCLDVMVKAAIHVYLCLLGLDGQICLLCRGLGSDIWLGNLHSLLMLLSF